MIKYLKNLFKKENIKTTETKEIKQENSCRTCRFNCEEKDMCVAGTHYAEKGLTKVCFSGELWEPKSEPKSEYYLAFLTDEMYIPGSNMGKMVSEPFYEGSGSHSVKILEKICEQYKEYCYQQAIIKQNCMKHVVELKFGIKL